MKKILILSGALLVAAAIAGIAQPHFARSATAAAGDRTITVSGNGVSTTVPDRASFQFGVTTNARDAKAALAQNASDAAAVIAALKAAGIPASDIQTSGVSLSPQTSPDGTSVIGYTASNTVTAAMPIEKAGTVVDAAVNAGANNVYGPSLTVSDQSSLYQDALKKAFADAKGKAQALAAAAGVQLGAVESIDEGDNAPIALPMAAKAADGSTPIEPGTQQIQASVSVTFSVS
ncbi:MAG: SIMPL domain-containing protein [Actinobacteria bacterium]|nr:SIMPL domain-containing protein [Actinomycetota bacterium]